MKIEIDCQMLLYGLDDHFVLSHQYLGRFGRTISNFGFPWMLLGLHMGFPPVLCTHICVANIRCKIRSINP